MIPFCVGPGLFIFHRRRFTQVPANVGVPAFVFPPGNQNWPVNVESDCAYKRDSVGRGDRCEFAADSGSSANRDVSFELFIFPFPFSALCTKGFFVESKINVRPLSISLSVI